MSWSRKALRATLYSCWLQAVLQVAATETSPKVANGTVNGTILLAAPAAIIAEQIQAVEWKYVNFTTSRSIVKLMLDEGNQKPHVFGDYSRRVHIYPNGSLSLRNVRRNDSGNYSCTVTDQSGRESTEYTIVNVIDGEKTLTNQTHYGKTNEANGYCMENCVYLGVFSGAGVLVIIAILIWTCVRCHRARSSRQGQRTKGEQSRRKRRNQNDDIYESMGRVPQ
ncbi:V-set and transmembrane domain-containing protein 5-like [Heterodontus francisci]|uniref:V-set and transmembrane domain-containing protein 5-like n=1 Tax=Heterodontus francisci TaxID=7792 RepID=UPI00355B1FCA